MSLLWRELTSAVSLIFHGDPYLMSVIWFTLEVAGIATVVATAIGVPIGVVIGLGRFPGRTALRVLANASMGMPPVIVGLVLFLAFTPEGPLGTLHLNATRDGVIVAQTVLALPYTVALSAAAMQALPGGLLRQARLLGAGRAALAALALREARVGVMAAVIAALATGLSEVAAIAIVGGNAYGYDQTLASAALFESQAGTYNAAVALGIVLLVLILVLIGGLSLLGQLGGGVRLRLRAS